MRRDVLVENMTKYFTISISPILFSFYILGRDDKVVQKDHNGGPGRDQDWELLLGDKRPSAPPWMMMWRYNGRFWGREVKFTW